MRLTRSIFVVLLVAPVLLAGCASPRIDSDFAALAPDSTEYLIGPGDELRIFVWNNPDVSVVVPVRPDGMITTPLVEDMRAVGKTTTQLARDIEGVLSEYIRDPTVNVIALNTVGGLYSDQIRVVGQAANPRAIPYRNGITLLDVMIEVGGLTPAAAGNRARIIRRAGGQEREIRVRIGDLLGRGDIDANVPIAPGDVIIIPESRF